MRLIAVLFAALVLASAARAGGWTEGMRNPLPMPFQRSGDPIFLPATATPQQYTVTQPLDTTSYRGVNPCGVDIRIKTVSSMSTQVTASTGTRFLARTAETLSSTANPMGGQTRIVSIMTVSDPGPGGCVFELQYGNGG